MELGNILIFLFQFQILSFAQNTAVSFCDGKDLFQINEADCHGGINFGERKPPCVCVSGIYRSWTEDCGMYDGFVDQYCFSLGGEEDDSYDLQGLRLVPGNGNIYQETVAVFGQNSSDFGSWNAIWMGMNEKTWSDNFYVINGFPVMLMKTNDKFICIEPAEKTEKQVCRYYANDNGELWEQGEGIRILLMENCEVKGYMMAEMQEHRCYDIVNKNVSECQLPCANGSPSYIPGSLLGREKKSVEGADGDGDLGGSDDSMIGPSVGSSTGAIYPSQPGTTNVNFFLHRKLNKYTRLRQTGQLSRPDISQIAPNRTFILLDIAKRIVRSFCPSNAVSDMFLDAALELFVVLHKGQDFRYIDDIPQRDFTWIQEILLKCRKKNIRLPNENFFTDDRHSPCNNEDYITTYEFINTDVPISKHLNRSSGHQQGKYHFVIDAIWLIIDLTHTLCFPMFVKSFRMFHVWEQASEKLFTRDIRNLWFNPQLDVVVYNALMSNRALVDMVNLDRCTEAAYKRWVVPELVRPAPHRTIFKRRKREALFSNEQVSVAKSVDVFCAKEDDDVIQDCLLPQNK